MNVLAASPHSLQPRTLLGYLRLRISLAFRRPVSAYRLRYERVALHSLLVAPSKLGSHHVGEEVQGARDAFWGDASSYIRFKNVARQAQRLLHCAQAFHNSPGRAEHHAFLQKLLIGQGCQLRGPRGALGAFELLSTAH